MTTTNTPKVTSAGEITATLAVQLEGEEVLLFHSGGKGHPTPTLTISQARWQGPDLYLVMSNGQKFQATFSEVQPI